MRLISDLDDPSRPMTVPQRPDPACPACRGSSLSALEKIDLAEQHRSYSLDPAIRTQLTEAAALPGDAYTMRRCDTCGLEFADPFHAPTETWYGLVYGALELYPSVRWEFQHLLTRLSARDALGEIGCGDGEFLALCKDAGVPSFGVDFSRAALAAARTAGLDAEVLEIGATGANVTARHDRNVIVAFQVLEHLADPAALFHIASAWAAPGATLWVAIPSNHRPSRYFRERDFLDQPPHHMTRWTERSLNIIGESHGWRCDRVLYEPTTLSVRLWWLATRHPLYRALQRSGSLKGKIAERLTRAFTSLLSLPRALATSSAISGQTMMAQYTLPSAGK